MRMLHKLVEFSVPVEDLINIFILYIRSVLEQSCQVWHSSLTFENMTDIERVQKNALKIILKEEYITYEHALNQGVIFPAGARVLPAGNMEEFTGNRNKNPRMNNTFLLIG